jgi:hypothetical protein
MPNAEQAVSGYLLNLSRKSRGFPGFDVIFAPLDTSSTVHFRSPSYFSPDMSYHAFSLSLTTNALNESSIRQFETSFRKPIPGGQTPISYTAPNSLPNQTKENDSS